MHVVWLLRFAPRPKYDTLLKECLQEMFKEKWKMPLLSFPICHQKFKQLNLLPLISKHKLSRSNNLLSR